MSDENYFGDVNDTRSFEELWESRQASLSSEDRKEVDDFLGRFSAIGTEREKDYDYTTPFRVRGGKTDRLVNEITEIVLQRLEERLAVGFCGSRY